MIAFSPSEVATYYASRVPQLNQPHLAKWLGACPVHKGKNDNFAVQAATGLWYCHSTCGRGGDVIALEMALTNAAFRDAVKEVEQIVGRVLLDRPASRAERLALARRRKAIEATARDIAYWKRGRVVELERIKANAVVRNDESALAVSASELYRLETDGAAVVAACRNHFLLDPRGARNLIEWAREDEQHVQIITAALVCLLSKTDVCDHATS